MNFKQFFRTGIALFPIMALIFACSSDGDDDAPPPPPTADCNATGPSIALSTTESQCGEDDGQIVVDVTGGTGNLEVTISPDPLGATFSNNTFSNVQPGSYTIEVTDADNCTSSGTATVDFTPAGLSYADDIDPIIQTNCVKATCHDGTNPDYRDFETFQVRAQNLGPLGVRQRVKRDEMPQDGPLSATDKALLFCWIDEGALNN